MIPEILYKYSKWDRSDSGNGHKILTIPEIYFANPMSFNDPFDCQLSLGWAERSPEEFVEYIRENHPNRLAEVERKIRSNEIRAYLKHIDEVDTKMRCEQSGVCCFASDANNSLLWAHYSAGHRGFCVGLKSAVLIPYLDQYFRSRVPIFDHLTVEYKKEMPRLDPTVAETREWFLQRYRDKANDWSYEREYRLLLINDETSLDEATRSVTIPPTCISEIILGCRVVEPIEAEIIQAVSRLRKDHPGISLLRARKSTAIYEYEISEI